VVPEEEEDSVDPEEEEEASIKLPTKERAISSNSKAQKKNFENNRL
jgi:hypothetical protein